MVRFPREFDVFLGDNEIKYQWYKPTTHYLGCSSPELRGFIECTADRRFLRVFGGLLT